MRFVHSTIYELQFDTKYVKRDVRSIIVDVNGQTRAARIKRRRDEDPSRSIPDRECACIIHQARRRSGEIRFALLIGTGKQLRFTQDTDTVDRDSPVEG